MITFKQFLAEAHYAPLFHATPLENLEGILEQGLYSEIGDISAARSIHNAKWYIQHEFSLYNSGYVIFELDQNKIRQRYKVVPFDYYMKIGAPRMRRKEAEEVIKINQGEYLDVKYIKKVYYFKADKTKIDHLFSNFKNIQWKQL